MWGTDGVRVFTVDDGWGWIFTAVEHWNAECVGWHVCKRGDRFAALQPISMGLAGLYGSTAAGAARGLALRMDHGSQYLSDHFTNQIKFWGIQPSYAFVAEPQTNGVAERFNRTLKEQIIHGRIYRNIAELRDAVRDFVELYNAQLDRRKERLPEPRLKLVRRGTPRSQSGPPRETELVSKEPGALHQPVQQCGTTSVIDPDEVRTLKPGDAIKLAVTNADFDNLDVTALFVDGRFGVVAVAAERLHRSKGPQEIVRGDIDQTSFGLERIVLIMVASDPGAERADFSFLAQPPVRLRGRTTRGGGGPGTLETLLRDAGFGRTATTRGFAKASDSALSKTRFAVFAWWTIPAK